MTIEKKIRIFYLLSIVGMVIGLLTVGFCLIGFNADNYGLYNLYITFIIQLGILSFGFQDGVLINYRKKSYEDMLPLLFRDLKFGIIFQSIILLLCLASIPIIGPIIGNQTTLSILVLAMVSFYPITLLGNIRNAFAAVGKFDIIGVVDFLCKLYLFISIVLVVIFKWDVYVYILIDIIAKLLIVVGLYFLVYRDYKKLPNKEIKDKYNFKISDNFKKGLWILVGNWTFNLVFSLDRSMIADYPELIGIYSYGMFVISTIFQFLTPIKSVFVSQIDENMTTREVYLFALRFCAILFAIVVLYISVGDYLIEVILGFLQAKIPTLIPTLGDIISGVNISTILVTMLPMYVVINIFFNTLLLIKNQKKYALVETGNAALSLIIYVLAVNIYKQDILMAVVYGSVVNYFVSFIYNVLITGGVINAIKLSIINGILLLLSLVLIVHNNILLVIVMLIACLMLSMYAHRQIKVIDNK